MTTDLDGATLDALDDFCPMQREVHCRHVRERLLLLWLGLEELPHNGEGKVVLNSDILPVFRALPPFSMVHPQSQPR